MFRQRNKIGTHVLGDRIAVEGGGRLMGGAELNGRHGVIPYKKSLIGANKTG
jgi:hypothetical protein